MCRSGGRVGIGGGGLREPELAGEELFEEGAFWARRWVMRSRWRAISVSALSRTAAIRRCSGRKGRRSVTRASSEACK